MRRTDHFFTDNVKKDKVVKSNQLLKRYAKFKNRVSKIKVKSVINTLAGTNPAPSHSPAYHILVLRAES